MINDWRDHDTQMSGNALERQIDEALRRRRRRALERRRQADLSEMRVYVDGEPYKVNLLGRGRGRIEISEAARLIEVFSGGEYPVHLANLLFSPSAVRSSRFHRVPPHSSYSVVLDGGIRVKFTVSGHPFPANQPIYSINIQVRDARIPLTGRLLTMCRARASNWGGRELAATSVVILCCLLIGIVAYIWTKSSSSGSPSAPGGEQASAKDPALVTPAESKPSPPPPDLTTKSKPPQPTLNNTKPGERAELIARIHFKDRARSASSPKGESDAPARLSRALNRIVMRLPEGSPKGAYTVTLENPFREDVMTKIARSADGKILVVNLDLRRVRRTNYRLCVSSGDEAPSCRDIIIGPADFKDQAQGIESFKPRAQK